MLAAFGDAPPDDEPRARDSTCRVLEMVAGSFGWAPHEVSARLSRQPRDSFHTGRIRPGRVLVLTPLSDCRFVAQAATRARLPRPPKAAAPTKPASQKGSLTSTRPASPPARGLSRHALRASRASRAAGDTPGASGLRRGNQMRKICRHRFTIGPAAPVEVSVRVQAR